jgi:CHAT domain-containing protein/tetratricopeptide (TPR) repeat protein
MRAFLSRFQDWFRAVRADAIALQLIGASEPAAKLLSLRQSIYPGVVDRLLTHAWKVSKTEGLEKGLPWVQLAKEASLINGEAVDMAECLTARGILLQDLHEESPSATEPVTGAQLLDEALQCMLEALAIREKLDDQEALSPALGHVSSVYGRLGKHFLAFVYRLKYLLSICSSAEDSAELDRPVRNLTGLFWHLSGAETREASDLLLQHLGALEQLAGRTGPLTRGDLFEILGVSCREVSQHERAFHWWRQACAEYSASEEPSRAFHTWARAQDLACHRDEPEAMVELGLHCIRTAPRGVPAEALASRHHLLAFGYDAIGQTADAIAAYHEAARIGSGSEDSSLPGIYLLEAAHLELEHGMLEEARKDFEKVLNGSAGAFTIWDAEYNLAAVLWRKGDLGGAIYWCDQAVALALAHRMSFALRVGALHLSAMLHLIAGNLGTVLERCDDVLQFFESEDRVIPQSLVWYYTNFIGSHCVMVPLPSAAAFLGLVAAQRQGSRDTMKRYLDLYLRFFAHEQAQTSEPGTQDEPLPPELRQWARSDALLAADPKQAIEILCAVLPVVEDWGPVSLVTHRNLGLAYYALGDTVQARASFNLVLELAAQYPSLEDEVVAHFHLGLIEMHSGASEAAYDQFSAVVRAKETQRGSLADLDLRQGFSRGPYRALIEVCRRLGRTRELLETVEKLKSRVLLDLLGSTKHRPIDYGSLREIKDLKQEREDDNRRFLLETHQESVRRLEELYAMDPDNASERWMAGVSLGKRQDEITARLLQHGFLVELDSTTSALSFNEIRELCVSSTRRVVLVEYLVTPTEVLVLGVRADFDRPELTVIPLPEERLSELARSGLAGLGFRGGDVTQTWQQDMAQLLAPALSWSEEGDLLWLVPHGPLHGLPLHAVKLDGRYLIERNPICYSASASVMKYCRLRRTGRRETALVLGDPAGNLPDAHREAQLVADIFGTTALLGGEATKSRLREALAGAGAPDILHFAGHSLFRSSQPLESAIELAPDSAAPTDYGASRPDVLTAGEVLALSLNTDLVTLSSCTSGAQRVGPGDEPVGFARNFLYAGAASVLASLWPVEDLSARILMEQFYLALTQGLSKAEALQKAQVHLLHLTAGEIADFRNSRYGESEVVASILLPRPRTRDLDHETSVNPHPRSHPYFWAPFILMGDWS